MHSFVRYIFDLFSRAVGPALLGAAIGAAILVPLYTVRRKSGKGFPTGQAAAFLLLLCYLGGLAAVTLLVRIMEGSTGDSSIQAHLFRAFREAWNAFTLQRWLNPLLNVAVFVPLGVLLPLAARPFRRWHWTLAAGTGASLVIEALQYILRRGSADVDDLFCNTLGAMLGYCLCMIALGLLEKKWKLAGACAVLPVLSAAFLAGVFIVYQVQPYGNLPDAPAFTANTRDVEWVLECELSGEAGPSGVYWAEPFTRESCDEFALAFAQRQGGDVEGEFFDTDYYDNTAFYSDHSTFSLFVDYNDRSYKYHDYRVDSFGNRGATTETELRAALENLGIHVPSAAEFSDEGGGQYIFRADLIEEEGVFIDGELRCYVAQGGAPYMVENKLSVCTLYGDAAVISQQEAYEQLRRGRFSHGDWFEYHAPETVRVTACELQYRIDTKGFRQPVYLFQIDGLDWVLVPALA